MKTFKRIDLAFQTILIMVIAIVINFNIASSLSTVLLEIVAVWQLLSIIIHFLNKWHSYKGGRRYNFQLALVGSIVLLLLLRFIKLPLILAYPIAYTILLMPLYYLWVCFMEVFYYTKRPLELI